MIKLKASCLPHTTNLNRFLVVLYLAVMSDMARRMTRSCPKSSSCEVVFQALKSRRLEYFPTEHRHLYFAGEFKLINGFLNKFENSKLIILRFERAVFLRQRDSFWICLVLSYLLAASDYAHFSSLSVSGIEFNSKQHCELPALERKKTVAYFLDFPEVPPNGPIVASLSLSAAGSVHIVIKLSKHVLKSKRSSTKDFFFNAVIFSFSSRYVLLLVVDIENEQRQFLYK